MVLYFYLFDGETAEHQRREERRINDRNKFTHQVNARRQREGKGRQMGDKGALKSQKVEGKKSQRREMEKGHNPPALRSTKKQTKNCNV